MALYGLWLHRPTAGFLWRSAGVFIGITAILLFPFIGALSEQSSMELSEMIAKWQLKMMGGVFSGNLFQDLLPILSRIKIGVGDLVLITAVLCLVWLMIRRRHMHLVFVGAVSLLLYGLILNAGYWLLPFSELLYPERTMYFYVVPFGILLAYSSNELDAMREHGLYRHRWALGFVLVGIALFNFQDRYWQKVVFSERRCDAPLMEAFAWIENHTEKQSVFHVNYDTEGMWIPALSYRATIGTHLHFIHERDHVFEELKSKRSNHYAFVLDGKNPVATDSSRIIGQQVFSNKRVRIFKYKDLRQ
jgi:hypothetical protein